MLEKSIIDLKKRLIEYSSLVENMVEKSMRGLLNRDKILLEEVLEKEEIKANNFEIELDDMCTSIIAQYEPKAKDLRTTLMILKMNNDLERVGDLAVNICESSLYLIDRPLVKPLIDIPRMANDAISMLKNSIKAFINEDVNLAQNVCERDDIVDGLRDQIVRELITFISSEPSTLERALQLINISKHLERVADCSTNIAEDVIFMVQGRVIKHHFEEKETEKETKLKTVDKKL